MRPAVADVLARRDVMVLVLCTVFEVFLELSGPKSAPEETMYDTGRRLSELLWLI